MHETSFFLHFHLPEYFDLELHVFVYSKGMTRSLFLGSSAPGVPLQVELSGFNNFFPFSKLTHVLTTRTFKMFIYSA